jgi:hypothetical protein
MSDVVAVPTPDQLADDPALVLQLSHDVVEKMIAQVAEQQLKLAAVQPVLLARLLATSAAAAAKDKLIDKEEAARQLGISPLTLMDKRHQAPYRDFVVDESNLRTTLFSERAIQRYIARKAGAAR